MLAPLEYHFLDQALAANELDNLLETGYFRTGNYLLRTRILLYNEDLYNLYHIRYSIEAYEYPKRMKKLLQKNKQLFYSTIQSFKNSEEKEWLYQQHKHRFTGSNTNSLEQYLYDYDFNNKFDTYEVNIFDKATNELIGFSLFDLGSYSMASIIGIYNQAYAKHSIGIYSMLLEIEYAKNRSLKYYYPGYIADKPSPFTYKIKLGSNPDYFDWQSQTWIPYQEAPQRKKVIDIYQDYLDIAEQWLKEKKIPYRKTTYPFYYMRYYYTQSNCMSSIQQFLIEDYELKNYFFVLEYNIPINKIIISAVTVHYLEDDFSDDINSHLINDRWQHLLVYVYPNYYVENANDVEFALSYIKYHLSKKKTKEDNE